MTQFLLLHLFDETVYVNTDCICSIKFTVETFPKYSCTILLTDGTRYQLSMAHNGSQYSRIVKLLENIQ